MGGPRTIVAMGGGGFQTEPDDSPLDDLVLTLARERSGRETPRICLVPTASADDPSLLATFREAFAPPRGKPTVLTLFERTDADPAEILLAQDAIYVTGGSTANLLAIWRTHGVDDAMRRAWDAGVVLAGMSAGAICWFESGTTDSFGPTLRPLHGALGLLPGSFVPHYHGEAQRRPHALRLIADGTLPPGFAVDDGAALVFRDREAVDAVASTAGAAAWRLEPDGDGGTIETVIPVRRPSA